jgi:hypothetical protein
LKRNYDEKIGNIDREKRIKGIEIITLHEEETNTKKK